MARQAGEDRAKHRLTCAYCGKPAGPEDRNNDGTYTHRECCYANAWPSDRKLFNQPTKKEGA